MFETWLSSAAVLLPESVSIRVIGESVSWKTIKPLDILDKFDVVAENEANRQATKEQRAQTVIATLQSLTPYLINPTTGLPVIDNADLVKFVFDQFNFSGIKIYDAESSKKFLDDKLSLAEYEQSITPTQPQEASQPTPIDPTQEQVVDPSLSQPIGGTDERLP